MRSEREPDAVVRGETGVLDLGSVERAADRHDAALPTVTDSGAGGARMDTGVADIALVAVADGAADETRSEAGVEAGSASFTALPALNTPRSHHSATVLPDGKVLIAGGVYGVYNAVKLRVEPVRTSSAELYDPATETFTRTGSLSVPRLDHTATLLPDGKVLIAGGASDLLPTTSAELYDPKTGTFQPTGALLAARAGHTATLLDNGKVLIAGTDAMMTASCELYDPATGGFTATGSMAAAQSVYSATLVGNGRVLIIAGTPGSATAGFVTAQLYDPATGTFSETARPSMWRDHYSATRLADGRVLIAGGEGDSNLSLVYTHLASAEVYDPATDTFTPTGAMSRPRVDHTATLLADGRVLMAGGWNRDSPSSVADYLVTAEIYDPASGTFTNTGPLVNGRVEHRAVALATGEVLLVGGGTGLNTAELYDPIAGTFRSRALARENHTAMLLASGKVLLSASSLPGNGALYDPVARVFTATGKMVKVRECHTATLLPNGKVLFAGGWDIDLAELYDPDTGTFSATGSMTPRWCGHTATLLGDGRVLIAGGKGSNPSTEVFDVATATFTASGSMSSSRSEHTATLLPNGMVLLAGGWGEDATLASAELYDPATGVLANTGSLATGRFRHTATLLPDGRVLVVGGWSGVTALYVGEAVATAEVYDVSTGSFSAAGSLLTARFHHSATVLPDGKVLIAGGSDYLPPPAGGSRLRPLASAELFDPEAGSFLPGPSMTMPRVSPTATLLPNGEVLVAGGNAAGYHGHETVAQVELYR